MNAITMKGLTKYYGKARVIEHADLNVSDGDFFGFIGPNGAGKSTTIRLLLGLIAPTSGTAEVLGKDIRREQEAILSQVGYMPSEANFYGNLRVGELIRFSARLRGMDCAEEAETLCRRLELDTGKKIQAVSLGNRKKVSIVRALQHRPRLCILDEPPSGRDPLMQRAFYEILQQRNEAGTTIFLSSHILSEIQRYCKHAAVIRAGRILVSDSIENLGNAHAKRVILRGIDVPPALENIRDVRVSDGTVSFLYSGAPSALLAALSALPLTDVQISEPDLEEVFMHYYVQEDA